MGKKATKRPRHVPQRTCIVCRQKFDKRQLTRIVRTPDEGVVIDPSGKRNGRGAYVCDQLACWDKIAIDSQLLNRALKTELTSDERQALVDYRGRLSDTAVGPPGSE